MIILKRLLVFVAIAVVFTACTTVKYIPVKETEYVTIKDSVYFRDTTVQYRIEKEYVRDYTGMLDTLRIETKYSEFEAHLDTLSKKLSGSARNKELSIPVQASLKEKVQYRDSIVYKEIPTPYEVEKKVKFVPWYAKTLSGFGIVFLILAALWAGKKFL